MSIINKIECIMQSGLEYSPFEIQRAIAKDGAFHSDSTITMSIRKLRARGHIIEWRYRDGSRTTVYRIVKEKDDKQLKNI